ncbi:hypothetical protein AB0D49_20235 [Streptomyces sp. NPDC048290]|uniref:hypothetical protein n=1 Tax=Streptomyces sp. NPDC048290 TaxID=3155811 RepID=UPI003421E0FB
MRSYGGVLAGQLAFAAVCCFPAPVALVIGCVAWRDGQQWAWIPFVLGLAGLGFVPVMAYRATRDAYPRITLRDRVRDSDITYADDSFVLWAPRSEPGSARAQLTRADVLEASLVRYSPDGEATYTTYGGDPTPDEFTPLVWMRLRVHDFDGGEGFEVTGSWRVPSLCLSAVTAGRLVVLVDPDAGARGTGPFADPRPAVLPQWPRSTLLAGTRTSRLIGLDGRLTEVTRRPDRLLRQMRVSLAAGGVAMAGDVIDLRRLDTRTAARYTELADRWEAEPEEQQAPVSEPGEEIRWLVDALPGGCSAGFGEVGAGWSRRGGVLTRARFLQMTATYTFQEHGPVLDTVLRIHPPDGTPPFEAARRLTVPMRYLALLHRTKEVVLTVAPNGRSYVVDWERTQLLAGTTTAKVVAPDGREYPLTGRPDLVWALMNLLAAQGVSNPQPVLDLRGRPLTGLRATVLDVVRGGLSTADADAARR